MMNELWLACDSFIKGSQMLFSQEQTEENIHLFSQRTELLKTEFKSRVSRAIFKTR